MKFHFPSSGHRNPHPFRGPILGSMTGAGKVITASLALFITWSGVAAQEDDKELAKKTQNPVSDLISLPFQNNFNIGLGPDDDVQWVLNIQPVWPFQRGRVNYINRTIAPVIYQPEIAPGTGSEFGFGDINHTTWLSPAKQSKFIWGLGPVILLPTATDDVLGSDQWGLGPSFVGLTMPGNWVVGGLVNNVWSVAGDDDEPEVNFLTFQYFANYNFDRGWYLTFAPIITADWEAPSDQRWIVPVGGGFGKISRIGKMPINHSYQLYYNVEHPDIGPDWQFRFQLQLLFPKKK